MEIWLKFFKKKTFFKHFPSSSREWNNSIYVYNKNTLGAMPIASSFALKLIKSFFNSYNYFLEKKIRKKIILLRLKRLSSSKIFISDAKFKHKNNNLVVTLYLYNRQKYNYILKLKRQYLNIFKHFSNKLNIEFNNIKYNGINICLKINNNININLLLYKYINNKYIYLYLTKFYKKLINRRLSKLIKFILYKQLLYLNNSKLNYIYLQFLKDHLELIFNKNIEFNLIDLKRFFSDVNIMLNVFSKKITKNRRKILRFLNTFNKKIKLKKKNIAISNHIEYKEWFENKKSLAFFVFKSLKYKYITGYRLEAKGRLTRRYTASRSRSILKYKGSLTNIDSSYKGISTIILKGNMKSNIQFTKTSSKTRIGSFGIKGWVSSN